MNYQNEKRLMNALKLVAWAIYTAGSVTFAVGSVLLAISTPWPGLALLVVSVCMIYGATRWTIKMFRK